MSAKANLQVAQLQRHPSQDARRQAAWLIGAYSDESWTVASTFQPEKTATIDFRYRLADGRLLVEAPVLYASVKEYAFWLRDPRFSRIDDAITHSAMVRNLMHIAHALSLRGIWSFAHIQPYDIEQLIEDCRYGVDGVIHASQRIESFLTELAAANASRKLPFGGLPEYVDARSMRPTGKVHTAAVLEACNLPSGASTLPRVTTMIRRAAVANGLAANSTSQSLVVPALEHQTVQALQRWFDPLEQLYAMRRQIEAESITFKPFARGAARTAAVKGTSTERTPIAPPPLALHLLEQATRWVCGNRVGLEAHGDDQANALRTATACWILIAAFTARRDKEIDELTDDCLRGDERSGYWLHVYIEKTLQRKDWIPIPPMVARAVELLCAQSATARAASGNSLLFQWRSESGNVVRMDVGRHLDSFAQVCRVPLHKQEGSEPAVWHWHPHQFRRFFSILYFYRFEGANIETLSHHLRHFSLEMTRRYITSDLEAAALWTDVEWGYMGHVARTIVSGERVISGGAGERLKRTAQRLLDVFRRTVQVVEPARVSAALTVVMQRKGLVLTPKPWVTCSSPSTMDAARIAGCRRDQPADPKAVGPDFARAGPTVCSSCPHAIVEGSRQSFIDEEVSLLEAATASKLRNGTLLGRLEQARLIDLQAVRTNLYQRAAPVARPADPQQGN